MKRLIKNVFIMTAASLIFLSCGHTSKLSQPYVSTVDRKKIEQELDQYVVHLMKDTPSYIPCWNSEFYKDKWNYIDGVILNSFVQLALSDESKKDEYMGFVKNFTDFYLDKDGDFYKPQEKTNHNAYTKGQLDTVCESRILFDLLEYTGDKRYINPIEFTYKELNSMPRTYSRGDKRGKPTGVNYSHKNSYYCQIWLDGTYMYVPFLARYGLYKNDMSVFDQITAQFKYIHDNMTDKNTGLLYHGQDTQVFVNGTIPATWADPVTGNSSTFWLRSIGWYVVAMTDALEYYPQKHPGRKKVQKYLKEALDALLKFQDGEEKLFYQIVDGGKQTYVVPQKYLEGALNDITPVNENGVAIIPNYTETSGSAMIAYALLKGARMGCFDRSYGQKGVEIFESLYTNKYDSETKELKDICSQAGLKTETTKDGTPVSYMAEKIVSNEAKGVGPFLMAYLEYRK